MTTKLKTTKLDLTNPPRDTGVKNMSKQTAASTRLETIAISQLPFYLKLFCQNSGVPMMLWGSPGIGKSEAVADFCTTENIHFEDIRLAQIESIDLRGTPAADKIEGKTKDERAKWYAVWAVPDFLQRAYEATAQGKRVLFFFDELNLGDQSCMKAAYQFINERRLGQHELPKDAIIICAGNFLHDGGLTTEMPKPLANRLMHVEVKTSVSDFLAYGARKSMHPAVLAFIHRDNAALNIYSNAEERSAMVDDPEHLAFNTPRSYTRFSHVLQEIDRSYYGRDTKKMSDEDALEAAASQDFKVEIKDQSEYYKHVRVASHGLIGSSKAEKFVALLRLSFEVPSFSEVAFEAKHKEKKFQENFLGMKKEMDKQILVGYAFVAAMRDLAIETGELVCRKENWKSDDNRAKQLFKLIKGVDVKDPEAIKAVEKYRDAYVNLIGFAVEYFNTETQLDFIVQRLVRELGIAPHKSNKADAQRLKDDKGENFGVPVEVYDTVMQIFKSNRDRNQN